MGLSVTLWQNRIKNNEYEQENHHHHPARSCHNLGADDVHAVLESGELLLAKLQQFRSQMERNKKILVK